MDGWGTQYQPWEIPVRGKWPCSHSLFLSIYQLSLSPSVPLPLCTAALWVSTILLGCFPHPHSLHRGWRSKIGHEP